MKKLLLINLLRRKIVTLYCRLYLGKDFTPLDIVPDELGCAEAVTTLLKNAGLMHLVIPGTWTLWKYLQKSDQWELVRSPMEADIIISPTGLSKLGKEAPFVGHVGIVGPRGMVYANNSDNGKWSTVYHLDDWKRRYEVKGGYPIYYYRFKG